MIQFGLRPKIRRKRGIYMDSTTATTIQTFAAIVQAIAAGAMIWLTKRLAEATSQQSKNSQVQTFYMKTQINLSLYKKRYQIYTALNKFVNEVIGLPIPKCGEQCDDLYGRYSDVLKTYWNETRERDFLLDVSINTYIESVEKELSEYIKLITVDKEVPSDIKEYGPWVVEIEKSKLNLLGIFARTHEQFKQCISYEVLKS